MTTALNSKFVLPADILLIPVGELAAATRDRLNCAVDDVAITRPLARRPSSIVDSNSAELLEFFREPSTVVDAIMKYSRNNSVDARLVLQKAFPVVERLVTAGVLQVAGHERARTIEESYLRGDEIEEFTIVDRVQILEDVEIHRARSADGSFVAIKIARAGYVDRLRRSLEREAHILSRLDGRSVPRVIVVKLDGLRPYLVLEWCAGVPPMRVADEHRAMHGQASQALLSLCVDIADAYANLHERGVLHGDVHGKNLLVDKDGAVTLLDFGLAICTDVVAPSQTPRGGIPEFYDPQLADALRSGGRLPVVDPLAEQYSVAALVYLVFAGSAYCNLSMRRDEALRQIVEEPPLSFEERHVAVWPALESVLHRALSKTPGHRYPSMRAFSNALRAVARPAVAPAIVARSSERRRFISALVERLEPGGDLYSNGLPTGPHCSVNNGAAGIAYAFHRMAAAREEAKLLAWADAWIARARTWSDKPEAWFTRDRKFTKETVGTVALYHSPTGIYCVETLIALATGHNSRADGCVNEFITASRRRTSQIDVTLGQAGLVVGALLMLEATPKAWPELQRRTALVAGALERRLKAFGPMATEPDLNYLGMAHGWSGLLWTLLRWYRSTGVAVPAFVEPRLQELAALATPRGRGLAWTWSTNPRDINAEPHPAPTWCNGTSGHMHTWLEAHATFGGDQYLDLAHATAWNIWDDSRDAMMDACCGLVGRSYALLALNRQTGDDIWRQRAEQLANRALAASRTDGLDAHRLYKGALGVALLLEELESAPDDARMPLFEAEGWRWDWR